MKLFPYCGLAAGAALLLTLSAHASASQTGVPPTEQFRSAYGCDVNYERHGSVQTSNAPTVILAHGFMRNRDTMRGWAQHWAELGIPSVLLDFCNSSLINGHHQRNADDMRALAQKLQLDGVVYAGFSAGGLAAYLAALDDPATVAYLGLDSVDSGDLARDEARQLMVPTLFLVGEPSMCNASGNFSPVFERWPQYAVTSLPLATHCHFEWPYEKRCGWLCGRRTEEETNAAQTELRTLATQWLLKTAYPGGQRQAAIRSGLQFFPECDRRLETAGQCRAESGSQQVLPAT